MTPQPDQGERAIFLAALEETSPARREALIERACAGRPDWLARVRVLLATHDESRGPLDGPPPGLGNERTVDSPAVERPGSQIGPYKLLRPIGEGGFGVVYAAEQQSPIRRKVALKIVKAGMDTREVIARFAAERQALAMMDHPNIAQVLGAGATEQGRPYFVMELVRGVPITEYCDTHNLAMRERLDLFAEVCHAVQHAHQKGIIHRDIKPSNILVAEHDGRPVPKVIDFGVSKALNQQLTEKTLFTAYGQMIGTPQYMSPEQAEMSGLDIDTRSDVYSLGVLLYEILTGTTPLDGNRLCAVGYAEVQRLIREDEPPKPSTRVSTLGERATVIARHRSVDSRRLRDQLRGELDWIVMRAIEKERGRRYETASALAEDIERYLRNEAVSACPPSAMYRLRKVARRNRALLTITAAIGGLLIAVTVLNTILAVHADRAGRLAEERRAGERAARDAAEAARRSEAAHREAAMRERDAAVAAEREASRQREAALAAERQAEANFRQARRAVDQYLATIRESPLLADAGTRPLREQLLESARAFYQAIVDKATGDRESSPDVAAAHLRRGQILEELGDRDSARAAYRAALSLWEGLGSDSLTAEPRVAWAETCLALDDPERAIKLTRAVLDDDPAHARARRVLHRAHLAAARRQASVGESGPALTHFHAAQSELEPLTSVDNPAAADLASLADARLAISEFHRRRQDTTAALAAVRGAIEAAEAARAGEPQTARYGELAATSHRHAARLLVTLEQPQEACNAYRRAVAAWSKLAFEHPSLPHLKAEMMRASRELAICQRSLDLAEEAAVTERRAEQFLAELPRSLGEDYYQLAVVHAQLAVPPAEDEPALPPAEDARRGDHATRAVELLRQAVELGGTSPLDPGGDPWLAHLTTRDDFRRLAAAPRTALGVRTAGGVNVVATTLRVSDIKLRLLTIAGLRGIADAHRELGQLDQAALTLEQCIHQLDELAREYPEERLAICAERGHTQYSLGYVHWHARRYPQAREAWDTGFELLRQAHADAVGPRRLELASAISHEELDLVNVYGRVGAWQEAARHRARYIAFDRFTTAAWEARFSILTLVADAGESYEDACRFMLDRHADDDPTHTAWMLMFGPQTVLDAAGMIELARRGLDKQPPDSFRNSVLARCERRADEGEQALQGLGLSMRDLFERAVVLQRMGEVAAARFALEMGEMLYTASARNWLASTDLELPGGGYGAVRGYWWEECYDQLWRSRAWEAINGHPPADPWAAMFEARGQALVGNAVAAEAAFERAVQKSPGDAQVWITRAESRAALGQFAEAEWDFARALKLEPDNPECWIARGKFFLERGLDAQADTDYRRAAELSADDLDLFVRTGVWGVGPFPATMNQSFAPEQQPHPARDVVGSDNLDDPDVELRRWKRVPVSYVDNNCGQVPLSVVTKAAANVSAYALAMVYAPESRTASLMIASRHHRRVWVNDVCVYDNPAGNDGVELLECVPISLRQGRNTIVVRMSTKAADCSFLLRLGDGPLENALAAARLMDWEQAVAAFERIPPRQLVRIGHFWAIYCKCLAAARDAERHASAVAAEYALRRYSRDEFSLSELLRAGTMLPHEQLTPEVLLAVLEDLGEAARPWQRIAKGRALYRAGEYAEAVDYYSGQTDLAGEVEVQAVTAMAYHRLGRAAKAEDALRKVLQQFTEWIAARIDKPGFEATWPMTSAHRWALLQEALELIRGETLADDPICQQLMRKVEAELAAIRPELADFDRALMFQPQEARLWLARGQRLAELSRWEEAEADLEQATNLKGDDPFMWLVIARYWLARERVAQASEACVRALDADRTGQWTHLARDLLASQEGLLSAVLEARPRDVELWSLRGEQLCEADRWGEAAQVWRRLIELGEETYIMWYRLALLQAGAGDIAAQGETCREMLQRFGSTESAEAANFTAWSCVLTPGALADYAPAESLAERFADANVALPMAHTTMGAVWLRAGRPEAAVTALTLADELNDPDDPDATTSSAYAWFLLAIAHHQVGQLDAARQWHDRATGWMAHARREQAQGLRPRWPWNRRLTLELLEREAARVLETTAAGRVATS